MKNRMELIDSLYSKNNNIAYKALKELMRISEETNEVYSYMDRFIEMLDSDNSYVRTRGLFLIAYNAKWDTENKVDEVIDDYLKHITDVKPITSRQCIKVLPMIAKAKPELKDDILKALRKADISGYRDSMRPLVYQDLQNAITEITGG